MRTVRCRDSEINIRMERRGRVSGKRKGGEAEERGRKRVKSDGKRYEENRARARKGIEGRGEGGTAV